MEELSKTDLQDIKQLINNGYEYDEIADIYGLSYDIYKEIIDELYI